MDTAVLNRFQSLIERREKRERLEARGFNLFHVLDIGRKESIRTELLRELLDPNGEHAQGDILLRTFLEHCREKSDIFPDLSKHLKSRVWVDSEVPNGFGRPDILLIADMSFVVVIENKVDAAQGKDQLERYHKWLKQQPEKKQALVYLTRVAPEPVGDLKNGQYLCLSYQDDIRKWLQRCFKLIKSRRILDLIAQTLVMIDEGSSMDMSLQQDAELRSFFKKNAVASYNLWSSFDRYVSTLRGEFWSETAKVIRSKLKSKNANKWQVRCESVDENGVTDRGTLEILSPGYGEARLHCKFQMQEYSRHVQYMAFVGVKN